MKDLKHDYYSKFYQKDSRLARVEKMRRKVESKLNDSRTEGTHAGHARHQNCRVRCVQHFWAREVGRLGSNNIFRALSRSAVFYEA